MSKKESMSIQIWIILILIGVASGMLSGFVGVGGGLIIVPALVLFLEFSQKMAQGTSLAILLLPVGILAVTEYYKHGYIDIKIALIISAGFVVGGFFGSKIALVLPQDTIKKVFAVFMLIVAVKMLFFDKKSIDKGSSALTNTSEKKG
jgi:uncharacterized membrane protein YfcA